MSNTTDAVWPYDRPIPSTHELINVFPGIDIVVDREFLADVDKVRADLREVLLERDAITVNREQQIAIITGHVRTLAAQANECGLARVVEIMGWMSNTTHSVDELVTGILALLPTLDALDLLDARAEAEFQLRLAADELAEVAQ